MALFLDIKAAYLSVDPEQLFYNMRKEGVPKKLTTWLERKFKGRKTMRTFNDYESPEYDVDTGLDQGCPMSVILYQFYNSPLLEIAENDKGMWATGNIDDVAILTVGPNFATTH